MPVLVDIRELITCRAGLATGDVGRITDAALAWEGERVVWAGPAGDLPASLASEQTISANGRLVLPGLVDAHTHICFGGWRADEFEKRCRGVSYQQIAAGGGGILRTVEQTRAADPETLFEFARGHLDQMVQLGVTTVECKSGYGLSVADELKILRVYSRLQKEHDVNIVSTFLGAHTVPPEFSGDRSGYVDLVCDVMLPAVAEEDLATYCDVFVEDGAFSADEARRILRKAKELGLGAKLHVDQLGDGGGASLAAEMEAVSADHLEYTNDEGIRRMTEAGVVPVALPLASLYLRQPPMNARQWIAAGCEVAVATDFNPGSAPSYHLPLAMMLACTMNGLTPSESVLGATRVAARAVGLSDDLGSLEPGKRADFCVLDSRSLDHWLYHFRSNQMVSTYIGGKMVWSLS